MNTPDTVALLNRLIVAEKNGESSLRAAAEEAWHEDLKRSLNAYSRFFGDSAEDLQVVVAALGGTPRGRGSFDNTLHRTWLHLRALALGRDEAAVLDAVEGDEAEAEELLAEALKRTTEPEVREVLERQYQWARRHHDTVHALREQLQTRH